MNLFNRIVLVSLLIALLAATLLSLLVPQTVLDLVRGFLDRIEAAIPFYDILSGAYWAFLGGGLGVVLLCLLLLWLELRRPRFRTVQVPDGEGRTLEVGVKAVTQRLQSDLEALADVNRVRPRVLSRGQKVDVVLEAEVHPAVDLPTKTAEITQLTRELIEEQIGARVGKVRVSMQYGPATPRILPEPELPSPAEPYIHPEPEPVAPPEGLPAGGLAEPILPVPPPEPEGTPSDEPEVAPEPVPGSPAGEAFLRPLAPGPPLDTAEDAGESPEDLQDAA